MTAPIPDPRPDEEQPPGGACGPAGQPPAGGAPGPAGERPAGDAPSPGGEPPADGGPGAGGEQEGGQRWGGPGWAWADTGPVPEYQRPGIQPEVAAGGGLPAGLDYQALLDALAAAGVVNNNPEDQDAEFDEWLAAGQEGRLEPADPARVAAVAVEHMDPGPAQAGWLGVAAGGADRLDESALAGVAVASRQLTSWGQACELAALARITARAAAADRRIGVDADGRPARVSRDAVGQVEMALRLTHYGAEARADLAVTLAWRLRATGAALAAGRIDGYRAQLIAEATSVLPEDLARRVEEQILPGAGEVTVPRLRQRLGYAVIAADPEGAEQRRKDAEQHAEMRLFAGDDQTATLMLTRQPQVEAAASFARVTALARARMAAGIGGTLNFHRSQVALGLLLGTLPPIPPAEGAPPEPGDDPDPDSDPGPGPAAGDRPDPGDGEPGDVGDPGDGERAGDGDSAGPVPDGGGPWDDLPAPRDEDAPPGDGPDTEPSPGCPGPADDDGGSEPGLEPTDGGNPGVTAPGGGPWDDLPAPRDEDAPADDGLGDDGLDAGPDEGWDPAGDDDDLCGAGPVPAWPALGAIPPALARQSAAPPRGRPAGGLLDVLLPWTTLAGLAERPGTLGRIGPVTAVQARLLAQAAGHDPAAAWRVIVTNAAGQAITVARIRRPARRARGSPALARDGPLRAGTGLAGRVTVTITQDTLTAWRQPAGAGPLAPVAAAAVRAGARALDRAIARAAADQAAGGCAHTDQSPAYRPPPRLREHVIARDVTCRNPSCGQPAWRGDLDHTIPWDDGGRTCRCDLGGACRRDHQLKQHPRWKLTQTRPGWFTWTAPGGRTYQAGPDTYPV